MKCIWQQIIKLFLYVLVWCNNYLSEYFNHFFVILMLLLKISHY